MVGNFLWKRFRDSGIVWKEWDSLCVPKNLGGLGFGDPGLFNQSLLTKVAWRILQEPQSLISRLYIAKHC
ncbi:hypothetical protein ACSBR1_008403 [Camellia fascicularis]